MGIGKLDHLPAVLSRCYLCRIVYCTERVGSTSRYMTIVIRLLCACRLKYFEEAFTSEHWMMRIYRVRCCCWWLSNYQGFADPHQFLHGFFSCWTPHVQSRGFTAVQRLEITPRRLNHADGNQYVTLAANQPALLCRFTRCCRSRTESRGSKTRGGRGADRRARARRG